jgi:hypothetical protein
MRRAPYLSVAFVLAALIPPAALGQRASAVFLDSPSSQIVAGDSMQLGAEAYDSGGNLLSSAQPVWSVSDNTVLTVDSKGMLHAITLGWADVYADALGARGTLRVQVIPLGIIVRPANQTVKVGDSVQYSADVLDINSQPLQGVTLQWKAIGPNTGTNNGVGITQSGLALTYSFGSYFIEASFTYTTGGGPFLQRAFGNTSLTVLQPAPFTQTKLLDSDAVRQGFQLRQRRGLMSVNDSGQIAYVGWMEGFATAALLWTQGSFTPVAVASNPGDLPGSNLVDIDDLSLNNNGEVSTRCIVAPIRNCMIFAGKDGIAHMILFDGNAAGSVTNIRNFATTRFGLNDNSVTLFRADYENIGSTTLVTGLFTTTSNGRAFLAVPAATPLTGLGTTYTFDRDFGLADDGSILFYATNGSSRALYRAGPDGTIARVVGTGDKIAGTPIISLGNVAVGKNGQYATTINNGSQYVLLFAGDPSKYAILSTNYTNNTVYAVSGAGEAVFNASVNNVYALYRWDGTRLKTGLVPGTSSPNGDIYTQVDSAGITAKGELIVQARTANNLLMVVNTGAGAGAKPSIVFQTGAMTPATAGPAFYNFVLNGHTGNPMVKTGWYTADVFEYSSGALLPRLVNGDRMPDGWFYEGNDDVRRNGDGDLFVSTDQSVTQIGAAGSTLLAHFPQRGGGGNLNSGFQVAANSAGAVALVGGTNFGVQHLSMLSNGIANPIAWLNGIAPYRTSSPGGGFFAGSSDIAVDENGTVYASLNVSGGSTGLFAYTAKSGWTTLLKIGDPYDGRNVTSIGQIRAGRNACYAIVQTTNGLTHLAVYQNGAWIDVVNYGDSLPTGGLVYGIGSYDINRNGAVAVVLSGPGGVQYLTYVNGTDWRAVVDNAHVIASSGELLLNFFQIALNDDGRIFLTSISDHDQLVLYEFDPLS